MLCIASFSSNSKNVEVNSGWLNSELILQINELKTQKMKLQIRVMQLEKQLETQRRPEIKGESSLKLPSKDIFLGPGDANTIIIEVADYSCVYCARYNEQVFPTVKQGLIDTGLVRYQAMHLNINSETLSGKTAAWALCESDMFWQRRTQLFNLHGKHENNIYIKPCNNDKPHKQLIAEQKWLQALAINGTPSFIIAKFDKGRVYNMSILPGVVSFDEIYQSVLAKKEGKL